MPCVYGGLGYIASPYGVQGYESLHHPEQVQGLVHLRFKNGLLVLRFLQSRPQRQDITKRRRASGLLLRYLPCLVYVLCACGFIVELALEHPPYAPATFATRLV